MTVVIDQRAGQALARRLRALRVSAGVAQRDLARGLGVSAPSVSAWESVNAAAIPTRVRLERYADVFCRDDVAGALSATNGAARSRAAGEDRAPLSPDEQARRDQLLRELTALRAAALPSADDVLAPAVPARRFWHFPDEAQVRIICGDTPATAMSTVAAADPWDPGYLAALALADLDAVLELFGHVRAENAGSDVRFLVQSQVTADDLTGHVVVLGPAASWKAFRDNGSRADGGLPTQAEPAQTAFDWFVRRAELPVVVRGADQGRYDGAFAVTSEDGRPAWHGASSETFAPRFLPDPRRPGERLVRRGAPQLDYDVALLARLPNPMNTSASLTFCSGLFTRGSYGAVRALTDANLRAANERWLDDNLDRDRFWLLTRVPVFQGIGGAETVTPDLARGYHVLARG